jgi:hypothetical protein
MENNKCNNKVYFNIGTWDEMCRHKCHFYISDAFVVSCEEISDTYGMSLCCKVNG